MKLSLPSARGWWWSDTGIGKRNIRRHQNSSASSWAATCSRPQAYFYLRPPSPLSSSVLSFPLTSSSLPRCFILSLSCLTFLQGSALRSVPTMYALFIYIYFFFNVTRENIKKDENVCFDRRVQGGTVLCVVEMTIVYTKHNTYKISLVWRL